MTKDQARVKTAEFFREIAYGKRKEDFYASHVTEDQKDLILKKDLDWATSIERGEQDGNLTVAQRMYYYMTGKTVAILP